MNRPVIADLFCGAGGAGMGLHRAGFEVVGFDVEPQPRYPFTFQQADALTVDLSGFDAVWASPVCKAFTNITLRSRRASYVNDIPATRRLLQASNLPYIIENVPGAPLRDHVTLCGQAFSLRVFRHRWFESSECLLVPPHERHNGHTSTAAIAAYHTFAKGDYLTVAGHAFRTADGAVAMGIDWMTRSELAQAIPPIYSKFLGAQLLRAVTG